MVSRETKPKSYSNPNFTPNQCPRQWTKEVEVCINLKGKKQKSEQNKLENASHFLGVKITS